MNLDPNLLHLWAFTTALLCLNLLFAWIWSGVVRSRTGKANNPEDSRSYGVALVPEDPPEVQRVLRAHANAQASIVPFVLLGLVYVLLNGPLFPAAILFIAFTLLRYLHTLAYLNALQPWRSIGFGIGFLATLALLGLDAWLLLR